MDALRIHCSKQNEYICQICSKAFCGSNALKKHNQQGCENADSEREINVTLEYDIDDIKAELPDDIIGNIEPSTDENPLLVPIESNILTSTKSREKSAIETDNSVKYDCYLCNQR